MARAYATLANGGRRVDGSLFGDRPRVVGHVERIRSGKVEENAPLPTEVTHPGQAELLTSILEDVVQIGTGRRAAVPGVEVAGKTGTNENYADAWFVGYTPELAVAVWVGYPDRLRPMTYEFDGEPVTGGTLPALIWKQFIAGLERANEIDEDSSFDSPPYLGTVGRWVVKRGGSWRLDNGYCRGARLIVYFSGESPEDSADCKPNEVDVPLVIGLSEEGAVARLAEQPLGADVVYKPAKAGKVPGIVLDQTPRNGGLSAHDDVLVVVSKARYGLLPNFVGSSLDVVSRELARFKLRTRIVDGKGQAGTIVKQSPAAGVATAPGLTVTLVVGEG
jgi:membrane peptidoglycan carboxypeptidase